MKKKVRKFTDKPGQINLFYFHWCKLNPLHKHEQLRGFPVFRSGRHEFYDQNIPHYRLMGLIIDQLSLLFDYFQHC